MVPEICGGCQARHQERWRYGVATYGVWSPEAAERFRRRIVVNRGGTSGHIPLPRVEARDDVAMEYLTVIEYCFVDRPGGSGRVAWDIACKMRDRGHSVTILCYRTTERTIEGVDEVDGMRVVRFQKSARPAWHPGRLHAIVDSAAGACRKWLSDRHYDTVHVHSPVLGLGVHVTLGERPKYVYTVHSPVVQEQEIIWRAQGWAGWLKLLLGRPMLARVERRMLESAATIHTLSEFTRVAIDRAYGVGGRVTVVPHWFTPRRPNLDKHAARRQLGWPDDARIFFTVRSMGPRYGLDVAIRALGPLTLESNCHFYLGGDGPLRSELEALAAGFTPGNGNSPRIHFLGRIPDNELEAAYAAADLFVLPTLALECFGLITIEALALGCPILGTDAGAIPESLRPILPEFVVPAGDVDSLRVRARQFLDGTLNVPDRETLKAYASDRYGETVVVPQLLQMLESH